MQPRMLDRLIAARENSRGLIIAGELTLKSAATGVYVSLGSLSVARAVDRQNERTNDNSTHSTVTQTNPRVT